MRLSDPVPLPIHHVKKKHTICTRDCIGRVDHFNALFPGDADIQDNSGSI